jgi:Xaa-Pro aminopeptidase
MIHIPKSEYSRRRKALMAQMEPNSIAILPAAAVAIRNRDVEHVYRQDSDFQYLSGFPEPQAVLVLMPGRLHGEYILFCRERNAERELWDGLRAGQEGAIRDFGADDAFPITDIDDILPGLIEGRDRVYSAMGSNPEFDRHLMEWINVIRSKANLGAQPPNEYVALDHLLHDMRLYKSAAEVKVMREAAQISARAHVRAMQASRAGLHEFSLEAELDYEFRKGGAKMPAYGSIVASGRNACILHYQENDAVLKDGDLVLIDAGCEIDCYASDITRTFPVSGTFSPEQKAIYELVLKSQEAAFAAIGPGKHWNQAHEATVQVITAGLVELGLLQGDVGELIVNEAFKPFYMHRAGHWLGMDVHDVGDYKVGGEWRVLEVGMTLTVEPGIYIAPDNQNVAKKWRGIGVRIEDDVVVTKQGCEILTDGVPKTVAEIEALMAAARNQPGWAA